MIHLLTQFIFFFKEKIWCIVVVGGIKHFGPKSGHIEDPNVYNVEVLTGDFGVKKLSMLPKNVFYGLPTLTLQNGTLLLCGCNKDEKMKKCFHLDQGIWKEHSTLNKPRMCHSTITIKTATFVFGGNDDDSRTTYEYLPKGSTTWVLGKREIPGGFKSGCAIAVKSEQEIWLIGGYETDLRILCFNVQDHTFRELPSRLNVGRWEHQCALIPNTNKILIAGGDSGNYNSPEILNIEDGSVVMASSLNGSRFGHGMGVITINGEDRVAVFGGNDFTFTGLNSVELYDNKTGKWEVSDIKLSEPRQWFGYSSVKLSDIISELSCTPLK